MPYCDVLVPGPWWHSLTYVLPVPQGVAGARIQVPVGRGKRIGFIERVYENTATETSPFKIRTAGTVIDDVSVFPPALWKLFEWGGRAFLCGTGELIQMASPADLLSSSEALLLPNPEKGEPLATPPREDFLYSCDSSVRWRHYRNLLERSERFLLLFPEQGLAGEFWKGLPDTLRESLLLWPSQGGKKLLAAWLSARRSEIRGVVGGPGAVFAPLQCLDTVIVDEECSGAYRFYKKPCINARTLAGKRARLESASLLLTGRVPSSRIFLRGQPASTEKPPRNKIKFVDLRSAFGVSTRGVDDALNLTEAFFTETRNCLTAGKTALWLLDRKGYAGEVACEDCGTAVRCERCGTVMAWEEKKGRLRCSGCGALRFIPEICPVCRGHILIGKRPGLEALLPVAQNFSHSGQPSVFLEDYRTAGKRRMRSLEHQLGAGGIVVGTRAALALCDILDVGFAGWVDVDAEIRSVAYQAKFTVFSMVWESVWRGRNSGERVVLLQSRRPGTGWQKGVVRGWNTFWREELDERKELGLPPFSYLLEIQSPSVQHKLKMIASMEEQGLSPMDPGDPPLVFWLTVTSLSRARDILAPFFSITSSKNGFPEVTVWID